MNIDEDPVRELEFLRADLELLRQEVDSMNQDIRQLKMLPATMDTILRVMLKNMPTGGKS